MSVLMRIRSIGQRIQILMKMTIKSNTLKEGKCSNMFMKRNNRL